MISIIGMDLGRAIAPIKGNYDPPFASAGDIEGTSERLGTALAFRTRPDARGAMNRQ